MPAYPLTCLCLAANQPQIAPVENDDSYDELKRDAKTCLSLMSQGLLYTEQIPMVLSALQEVSHWQLRLLFNVSPASPKTGLFMDSHIYD